MLGTYVSFSSLFSLSLWVEFIRLLF